MEKFIREFHFNACVDDNGNYISYAQLNFPYYSPEDGGGRVYFREDRELDRKMKNIREISKKDIREQGKKLVETYYFDDMTLKDFNTLFEINSLKNTGGN